MDVTVPSSPLRHFTFRRLLVYKHRKKLTFRSTGYSKTATFSIPNTNVSARGIFFASESNLTDNLRCLLHKALLSLWGKTRLVVMHATLPQYSGICSPSFNTKCMHSRSNEFVLGTNLVCAHLRIKILSKTTFWCFFFCFFFFRV